MGAGELTLFRSSQYGDDQDRPLKKSDGHLLISAPTPLITAESAFGRPLVKMWGADHAERSSAFRRGQGAHRRPRRSRRQLAQMFALFRAGSRSR